MEQTTIIKRNNIGKTKVFFLFSWVIFILSADLKVTVYPYIHWLTTLVLLLPVIVYEVLSSKMRIPFIIKEMIIVVLFIISVLISGINSGVEMYSLIQAFKLSIILVCVLPFFVVYPNYAHIAFKFFSIALFLNLILIVEGIFGGDLARIMTGDGRWGTVLNYPGSLGKLGVLLYVFALYTLVFSTKMFPLKSIILLLSCIMVVYFDGSRTMMLFLLLGTVYVFILILLDYNRLNVKKFILSFFLLVLLIIVFTFSDLDILEIVTNYADRFSSTANNILVYGLIKGLYISDPTRFEMIELSLKKINDNPFVGTGIGTTVWKGISNNDNLEMVVHNTYLQVWADLGLLGFISYVSLVLMFILWTPKAFSNIRKLNKPEERAKYYSSFYLLFYFMLYGLFHPLSTEWSEWILFIIPYAIFKEISMKKSKEV